MKSENSIPSLFSVKYIISGEILKFGAGVNDFISQNPVFPQGEFLTDAKIIFDFIIENVAKVKNGRPDCFIYYVCTSNNEIAVDIEATQTIIKNQIDASAYSF